MERVPILGGQLALELGELGRQLSMGRQDLSQPHEGADHGDAHFDRLGRAQYGCGHHRTVLGEHAREVLAVLTASRV